MAKVGFELCASQIVCYGSLFGTDWPTDRTLYKGNDMTAISALYDPTNEEFVIAADGRCNGITDTGAMILVSDSEQKIHHTQSKLINVAYALSGVVRSASGSFNAITETIGHIRTLSMRPFHNATKFIEAFSSKMEATIEKALANGTFPPLLRQDEYPPDEVGRAYRVYLIGFYHNKPFGTQLRFYVDKDTKKASTRRHDFQISTFCLCCTGSERIAEMIYGNVLPDSRIAKHKHPPDASSLEAALSFIKACSDPHASEIDPECHMIGGKLHAAKITRDRFQWVIPPDAQ